jgi:hypothetical protein
MLPEWGDTATVAAATVGGPRPGQIDREAPTQVSPDTGPEDHFTNDGTLIVGADVPRPGETAPAKSSMKNTVLVLVAVVAVVGIGIGVWRMQTTTAPMEGSKVTATAPVAAAKSSEPSSAGTPATAPKPSLDEVTTLLETMPCSVLQASMNGRSALVRGYVASPKVMKRIEEGLGKVAGITEVKNEIQELPRIYCQTLELYAPYWTANRDAGFGTAIGTPNANNTFVEGERLVVDIGTPTYKSWLYVDYFAKDGSVVHMMPSPGEVFNQGDARNSFQLGEAGDIGLWEVAPPFGTEMIVVLAASAPVFEGTRGELEQGDDYRAALRKRLKALESQSRKAKISADFVVINTKPRS